MPTCISHHHPVPTRHVALDPPRASSHTFKKLPIITSPKSPHIYSLSHIHPHNPSSAFLGKFSQHPKNNTKYIRRQSSLSHIFDTFIIVMASFLFHLVLIMAFLASPLLSLSSSQLNSKATTVPSSSPPIFFTNPPPSSFQELSPDITPLLPSPGGVVPTPTSSSVSTIPSNPSPPNPDDFAASGPAFSPFGSMQAVSAAPTRSPLHQSSYLAAFACLAAYIWICVAP